MNGWLNTLKKINLIRMKKRVKLTEFQAWQIEKRLLEAKAKRLGTTPEKLKKEAKMLGEIQQAIKTFKYKK